MPKIKYKDFNFSDGTLALIRQCNAIIAEYTEAGYRLTLRQLYYQLVSRDIIANRQTEYKRLGSIVNDGRLAGLIDWNAIEDRTHNLQKMAAWNNPAEIVEACAAQFHVDMWEGQEYRPEVWIEKDALLGVIEPVCHEFDVPFFSCRGYTSQSEMWAGAMRFQRIGREQTTIIFHLGDHDPSGKDMTRDIIDRMELFMGGTKLERLALNMDQVKQYNPPPNPAKFTDSRCAGYVAEFGESSWELDALRPDVLDGLIRGAITALIDQDLWDERQAIKDAGREHLKKISTNWLAVERFLSKLEKFLNKKKK